MAQGAGLGDDEDFSLFAESRPIGVYGVGVEVGVVIGQKGEMGVMSGMSTVSVSSMPWEEAGC